MDPQKKGEKKKNFASFNSKYTTSREIKSRRLKNIRDDDDDDDDDDGDAEVVIHFHPPSHRFVFSRRRRRLLLLLLLPFLLHIPFLLLHVGAHVDDVCFAAFGRLPEGGPFVTFILDGASSRIVTDVLATLQTRPYRYASVITVVHSRKNSYLHSKHTVTWKS